MKCVQSCVFDAISDDIAIFYASCEGCGVCKYVCPVDAITMVQRNSGEIYESTTRFGPMIHARLYTAEEASGKLVTMVRKKAEDLALSKDKDLVLIDGPPGIGCPVISAITGVDLVVIVTEPTYSGIHDLKRVEEVANHFGISSSVIINKSDINNQKTQEIISYCKHHQIPVLGTIPYHEKVTKAMIAEQTIPEFDKGCIFDAISTCWNNLNTVLDQ
jgi:MinD superfamily P-loop ATPase